ncbi:MAG: hypothetical protein HYT64_02295 [Candidatus Yanofskybacteria bacterium]|nr:hypothetical protein [Candidatus Yanofskybacteria bacterium]
MIPQFVRPFLWSYDVEGIDLARDKKRIITNILNLGSTNAVKWLFGIYVDRDIKEAVANPLPGEWSKKSLNFWALVFGIKPNIIARSEHFL